MVEPMTIATITNVARKILFEDDLSEAVPKILLGIVAGMLITVVLCFYLITIPFSWLDGMFSETELADVTTLRDEYGYAAMEEVYYDYVDGFDTYGGVFALPCENFSITNPYGMWFNPIVGKNMLHRGLDMQPAHHAEIMAVYDGIVIKANHYGGDGYGNCVEIEHELNSVKIYTFYAHLSQVHVDVGDEVEQGDVIGLEGGAKTDPHPGDSTGHHLHFEVRKRPGYMNDIDPYPYLFDK